MEKTNNIVELKVIKSVDKEVEKKIFSESRVSNPITKKLTKFFMSSNKKFNIKDLFR